MLRVGLTGGIATGKSRVLRRFAAAGFHTLDLDQVAHEVMAPGGPAHADVVAAFGRRVLTAAGEIDRRALGALVFGDAEARRRLNAIVHPRVREEDARRARVHENEPGAVVVTDAALLVEAGVHLRFDRLVVVHCAPEVQVRRLMARDHVDEQSALARVAAQMPGELKRRFAHFEIDSSGTLEELDRAAESLAATLSSVAVSTPIPRPIPFDRALSCVALGPTRGPRGLDPARLVAALRAGHGLEMESIARGLVPAPEGPWYEAAREAETSGGPETLAAALALWSLARGAPDPDFLAAASFSLARLTHVDSRAIATACFFGQAFLDAAVSSVVSTPDAPRVDDWRALASRWGGADPEPWADVVLQAVARHPEDPEGATQEAAARGASEPALAGGLVALVSGGAGARAPEALAQDLAALLGVAR